MSDRQKEALLRQLRMLRLIPRQPRKVSVKALQTMLEIDGFHIGTRTIQRDLNDLSSMFPVIADEAKPKGWSWLKDASQVDIPHLDPQTALTFHLVEQHLQPLLPASTLNYLAPWFSAASEVLNMQGSALSRWRHKVRVLSHEQAFQPPDLSPTVQQVITQALLEEKQLRLAYVNRESKQKRTQSKEFLVNPLALVVCDQVMYLLCTMWEYTDVRHLALHRIEQAEIMDTPAVLPESFDLDAYIASGVFGLYVVHQEKIRLVVQLTPDAALGVMERPFGDEQKIEELDNGMVQLTAQVADTLALRWWLLGFGNKAEIMEPLFLRAELGNLFKSLAQKYA